MSSPHARYRRIPLDEIEVLRIGGQPLNPRGDAGDTTDLQASLQVVGQIEPVIVDKPLPNKRWPLIDGHRRLVAFRQLLAQAQDDKERDKWSAIAAVERPPAAPAVAAMLAANVRVNLTPTRVGQGLIDLTTGHQWPLLRAARALGLEPGEAEHYVRAAQAPENVRRRVDNGEIAWSTWRRKIAKLPPALQEEVARMDEPTADKVRRKLKQMRQPAERLIDDETLVERANEARTMLQTLLDARPWGDDVAMRMAYVFSQIHQLTEESL